MEKSSLCRVVNEAHPLKEAGEDRHNLAMVLLRNLMPYFNKVSKLLQVLSI